MIYEESVVLTAPFDEVVPRVKEALAAEGFGTLTEIDLRATLKTKIDKDIDRYVIIGACNPHLAGRALDVVPQIGVLLPCNVVVRETEAGVVVEAMDPALMSKIAEEPGLDSVADEARELINNALARLDDSA